MESIVDILSQGRDREAQASKVYGLVIGIVTNNQDPDNLCRVKVKFPWLGEEVESWWCRCAQPMAGAGRGTMLIPEVEDEVLVGFEHGDVRFPYVIGALYNGQDAAPTANDVTSKFGGEGYDHGGMDVSDTNQDGKNNIRMFKSKAGSLLLFDDTPDAEKIVICDSTGKRRIEFHSTGTDNNRIVITNEEGDMELITKETFLVRCKDFKVEARETGVMEFGKTLDVTAAKDMTLHTDANMSQDAKSNFDIAAGSSGNLTAKAGMNVNIDGKMVTAKGATTISVQGGMAELKGDSMTTIKGGLVSIN